MLAKRLLVCALGVFATAPAFAQEVPAPREGRPYRGVFAHAPEAPEQLLTLTVSGGGGADRGVPLTGALGDTGSATDSGFWREGRFGLGSAQLRFSLDRDKFDLGASAAATTRLYGQRREDRISSEAGTVAASVHPFKSTTISAMQSASYQPYTLLLLMPALFDVPLGETMLPDQDLAARTDPYTSYTTSAGITQAIPAGRRGSLSLDYGYQRVNSSSTWLQQDRQSQFAGGMYRHGLTRDLGYHLGYHYRRDDYPRGDLERRLGAHNLDAGVDLNHAFSLTRRTTLAVSTGTGAYTFDNQTEYRIIGDARLTREIGRTWAAFAGYSRNIGFIDTLDAPVKYDRVSAGVNGLITRRLQFESNVRASTGELGFSSAGNGYWTSAATVTMTQALTGWLALGGSYSYYRYSLDSSAYLPVGTFLDMNRQAVRVYLTAWAPLLHRARKPHATR